MAPYNPSIRGGPAIDPAGGPGVFGPGPFPSSGPSPYRPSIRGGPAMDPAAGAGIYGPGAFGGSASSPYRPSILGGPAIDPAASAGVFGPGVFPSAAYHAKAVHFARGVGLTQEPITVTDSALFTYSGWLRSPGPLTGEGVTFLFTTDENTNAGTNWAIGYNFNRDVGGFASLDNLNNGFLFYDTGDVDLITPLIWHHVFWAEDTNHDAGLKIKFLYVDGINALDPSQTTDTSPAFITPWNGLDFYMPDNRSPSRLTLDFADVQMWVGQMIDPTTNISKFISGGKPVNPSVAATAFGTQTFLFSGDHTTFPTNQGTGGAFTLTGTLTDASTSPSD